MKQRVASLKFNTLSSLSGRGIFSSLPLQEVSSDNVGNFGSGLVEGMKAVS